jgi:hypothetical protein
MRLTLIVSDGFISVDGLGYNGFDMNWVPKIDGTDIHALQWYEDHGEIELVTTDPNVKINDLGEFNQAYKLWKEKFDYEEQLKKEEELRLLEEEKRIMEENKEKEEFLSLFDEEIRSLLEETPE